MQRRIGFKAGPVGLLLALFVLLATPLTAQQTTGKIEGRVTDQSTGQPLAGAQVQVVGTRFGNVTNEEGYYFINNVPAGVHGIMAQYIGYQTTTVSDTRVLAGQAMTVNFSLSSSAIALEPITVVGESNPLVARDQVQTKAVVTRDVVDNLPVENVRAVVSIQPGVVETGNRLGQVIRGGRPGEAAVYIDGVLVRNFNAGAQSEIELQNNAVEEVDVLLGGFGAEYGQAQSGVINLVSRGGGSEFGGAFSFETDEITTNYGYNRLEAAVNGPILGDRLGFSLSVTGIGMKDARPTFMGSEIGTVSVPTTTGEQISAPVGQTVFYRPTGVLDTILVANSAGGMDTTIVNNFEVIDGLDGRLPNNNGDEYNINLTLRGTPSARTRFNLGGTIAREQRRFFDPQYQFRPEGLLARRDKSWLIRGGIEQVLLLEAERSASVRLNLGYGEDEFVRGFLGETLADTSAVRFGDKYPMEGDFLGFTFEDFKFPFEDAYTIDAWMARYRAMQQDPSLGYLVPFEALINPATGENYTQAEATQLFQARYGPDNPFGLQDFFTAGYSGYGYRVERTFSVRGDLDWQMNRFNRLQGGAELYRKYVGNIGSGSAFGTAQSGVSNTSPTFQNVYEGNPVIAGFYLKDRVDLGDIVLEVGGRLDMFDSDALYPTIPGFVLPVTDAQTGETITPQFTEQETQWQFSPRLGVGFPVTENTQFRLSYGHFTQVPALNFLLGGVTSDLAKTNPNNVFGRPIDFGRTIGYEAGFTHSFDPNTVLDLSGYSREIQGGIAFRTAVIDIPNQPQTTVRFLTNGDFGYVRGLDTRLSRRFASSAGVQASYSLLVTRSTGSDPNTYLTTIGRQTDPVTGEPFTPPQAALATDFDQRHQLSISAVLTAPEDLMADTRWANTVLRNWDLNAAFQARSGLPYTRSQTPGSTSDIFGPDPIFTEPVNASRLPWTYTVNTRLGRAFTVGGSRLTAYVDARNLLNFKNVLRVWSLTGDAVNPSERYLILTTRGAPRTFEEDIDISGFNALEQELLGRRDLDGDGILSVEEQYQTSLQSYLASGFGTEVDIEAGNFLGAPRQVRLGLEWRF